jgi:hypothetical protein
MASPACVGPATLADVFSQAGFAKEIALDSPVGRGVALGAHSTENNPYDRMRLVLERGWLQATRSATGDEDEGEESIPPGHWKGLFREMTIIQRIPASSGVAGSETVQRAQDPERGKILFSQAQVIDAEARISGEEFEWRIWTISQILGWLAYRTESKFRSLDEADLSGRAYLGLRYAQDFENDNLEVRLVDILLGSRIIGHRDGKEVGFGEFTAMNSVWDISDVTFSRDVILKDPIANSVRDRKRPLFDNYAVVKDSPTTGSLSPPPPSKRGRPPDKCENIQIQMLSEIALQTLTPTKLRAWKRQNMAEHYKAHPQTVEAARKAVLELLENVEKSIPTISGKE